MNVERLGKATVNPAKVSSYAGSTRSLMTVASRGAVKMRERVVVMGLANAEVPVLCDLLVVLVGWAVGQTTGLKTRTVGWKYTPCGCKERSRAQRGYDHAIGNAISLKGGIVSPVASALVVDESSESRRQLGFVSFRRESE